MTVNTTVPRYPYIGNGVTTAFPYNSVFLNAADLKVYQNGVLKTLNTHYTVSGGGGGLGTVTFLLAPANGDSVVLLNDHVITQLTDLVNNDPLPAETLERTVDRLTLICQRLSDRADYALSAPPFDIAGIPGTLPAAATRANKVLQFDSTGSPTVAGTVTFTGTDVIQVTNIAALKALLVADLVDGQIVATLGYHTAAIGGAGRYRWDAASTTTPDNVQVFQLNAGGAGRFILIVDGAIDLKQAGAKGDGATNDAAAIQAAVNTGKPILATDGDYAFSTALVNSGNFILFSNCGFPVVQGNSPQNLKPRVSLTWTGADATTPITLSVAGASQIVFKDIALFINKTFTGTALKVRGADASVEANRADVEISPAIYRTPLDYAVGYAPGDSTSKAMALDCVNDGTKRTAYGWRFPNFYAFNFGTGFDIDVSGADSWFNGNFFGDVKMYQVYRALDCTATAVVGETISDNVFRSFIIQPGLNSGGVSATGCIRFDQQVISNVFLGCTVYDIPDANKLVVTNAPSGFINLFVGSNLPYSASCLNISSLEPIISFPDKLLFSRNNSTKVRIDGDGLKFGGDTAAANALDDYEEGSITPDIRFGGGTTGITYGSRSGGYTKIGNAVHWWMTFALTSKGSSIGSALIHGLPVASGTQFGSASVIEFYDTNLIAGEAVQPFVGTGGATFVTLRKNAAISNATMTDADFKNNTTLRIGGTYFV